MVVRDEGMFSRLRRGRTKECFASGKASRETAFTSLYFWYRRNMETKNTTALLNALGQTTRFDVVRLLLEHEPEGLSSGDIARSLDVPPNTMSAHLSKLTQAGVIRSERHSRFVIYHADRKRLIDRVEALLEFCRMSGRPKGRK